MPGAIEDNDLSTVIEAFLDDSMADLFTSTVARVDSYNSEKGCVNVKPIVRVRGESVATLVNIPVYWVGGGDGSLTFPIKKGDNVLLIFCMHSIDRWLTQDGADVSPQRTWLHNVNNAFALAGVKSFKRPLAGDAHASDGAVLKAEKVFLISALASDSPALASKVDALFGLVDTQLKALAQPGLTPPPISTGSTKVFIE